MPISLENALEMFLPRFEAPVALNLKELNLVQLSDECQWYLVAGDPEVLKEEILENYEDYLLEQPRLFDGEAWSSDVVPFAVITHEDTGAVGTHDELTTMLFLLLSEGDEGTCPVAVCYSDDFDLDRVCDRLEDLMASAKQA